MSSPQEISHAEVIARVEQLVEGIVDSLSRNETLCISLKFKKKNPPTTGSVDTASVSRDVCFPGKTAQEAWRFTVLFRILGLIHEALISGAVVSKRNIYYKDPALFQTQSIVDHYVDVFAYTLGVPRNVLNVTAAAKGLVAGEIHIVRPDGSIVTKGGDGRAYLIDDASEISSVRIPEIAWIVVVEKESSFRTLAVSNGCFLSAAGRGIIITAKGYPDLSTRSFLRQLSTSSGIYGEPPPIFALTDYDPDGIAIMSTYKHGSQRLAHENAHLVVPNIQWLGIRSQDLFQCAGIREHGVRSEIRDEERGILRMSQRDRKKAMKMLENSKVLEEGNAEGEWRRELQVMLMLNVKAEMEILSERVGGLKGWVEEQLVRRL